ncbi:MAG: ATP-binding protein [Kofleriaceae bacterium]
MNRLLRTQLRRFFGGGQFDPTSVQAFLTAVDAAYNETDQHSNRLVHSISVMCDELESRNAELAARNARLEHLNSLVVDLARNIGTEPYRRITATCGYAFNAARTSVWAVEGDRMRCLDLFTLADGSHTEGVELHGSSFPAYFDAIRTQRSLAAHDARTDPRTCEFTEGYLVPLGITSMLDSGAFADNELRGVLCVEHTGSPRRWTAEEIAFAGSVSEVLAVAFESRRRRETQSMLDHQRAFLRQVIDLIPNLIFAKDRDNRFTLVNDATATFYGTTVAELLGKRDDDFNPDHAQVEHFQRIDAEVLATLREHFVEERATNAAGEERWLQTIKRPIVEPDGQASMVLGVSTDITAARTATAQREKLEGKLRQAQKLESLGLLSGGIAHDLNNILTPVLMTASMMLEVAPPDDPQREDYRSILDAAESARELTRQLLAFGRKQVLSLAIIDLNQVITQAIRMIARLVPASVRIETRFAPHGAPVRADASQMNQVIVNLIMNACDALHHGGRICCGTEYLEDEQMIALTVEDNGTGMDEQTVTQIFDPFFTTKELGRGTGLGLATVHGIVEQHHGTITVESTRGRGTKFTIKVPRRDRITAPVAVAGVPVRTQEARTILLVEDESPIRRLVQRVLNADGYVVLSAEHAEQALSLVKSHHGRIDLLLTDVVLPGMSGPVLFDRLREHTIERVIFMSGHARDALKGSTLPGGASFLPKPFTVADLHSALHNAFS